MKFVVVVTPPSIYHFYTGETSKVGCGISNYFWSQCGYQIHRFIDLDKNFCGTNDSRGNSHQRKSPINIVDSGAECMEYHQIRTKYGYFMLDYEEVSMEIHQNKLRIV